MELGSVRSSRDDSFLRQLVGDVVAAHSRLALDSGDGNRRDLVRAIFAAIDGVVLVAREHVRTISAEMGHLTPIADLALRERSFTITRNGELIEQPRFVPLPTMVRLIVNQVQRLGFDVGVEFDGPGWSALQSAIAIRNRATHPKTIDDLVVAPNDVETIWHGLFWLLRTVESLMAHTNAAFTSFVGDMDDLLGQLAGGDPVALAAYRAVQNDV